MLRRKPIPRVPLAKLKKLVKEPLAANRPRPPIPAGVEYVAGGYVFKTTPYTHQREALKRSANRREFALFMEPGTGKSKILLDTTAFLWDRQKIDRLLLISPVGVHREWQSQIDAHLPDWVPRVTLILRPGLAAKDWDALRQRIEHQPPGLLILSMHVEGFSSLTGRAFLLAAAFLKGGPSMIAIDESHRIKNPNSVRSKTLRALARLAAFRRVASGSEITQGYEDLFGQFRFLDDGIIGLTSFTAFKHEYCKLGGFEGREIVGYRNVGDLMRKIEPFIYTKRLADCMDLPARVMKEHLVELSDQQREVYRSIVDEHSAMLESGALLTEQMGAIITLRLRQVVSGFMVANDKSLHRLDCPRIDETVRLVEEDLRGKKVIIYAAFVEDVQRLKEAFGVQAVTYYGRNTQTENDSNLDRFRLTTDVRVLLATPDKGGVGFTINQAEATIYYSSSFNYEHRVQSLARNYRIGQDKPTVVYDLIAPGTVDRKLSRNLDQKKQLAESIKDPSRFLALLRLERD